MIAIVPSYNPDHHLKQVIRELHEKTDFKIVVVDDGSNSDAKKHFECLSENDTLLVHEKNRGKGAAMKTALSYVQKHFPSEDGVVFLDGDGQHKTEDLKHVVEVFYENNKKKIILGSRTFSKNIPWKSKFGNSSTIFFFYLVTGKKLSDTQTGLRVFPFELIPELLRIHGDRYEYEMNTLVTMVKKKKEFIQVPIETIYENNENETTHFRPIIDSIRIYSVIFKFLLSSGFSAVADYGLFVLLLFATGQPKEGTLLIFCNVLARVFSATLNYLINRNLVFYSNESRLKTAIKYAALALFILALNSGLLYVLTGFLHLPPIISKVIVETISFSISFLVQQRRIF